MEAGDFEFLMSDHSDLTARSSRVFASNRDSIGHAFVAQVDYRGHIIPCHACALIEAFSAADASGRQEVFPVLPRMQWVRCRRLMVWMLTVLGCLGEPSQTSSADVSGQSMSGNRSA